MVPPGLVATIRSIVVVGIVALMAALSSGLVQPAGWLHLYGLAPSAAYGQAWTETDSWRIAAAADNGPACEPRPSPRLQTVQDATGALQVTISAATASDGDAVPLHEIRLAPLQNAAVNLGPFVARTTPLAYTIPGGTLQIAMRVTRIVPGQPSHVTLVLVDVCGEWRTFVGGGTGVAIPQPSATATTVPMVPGQPYGSIPIALTVSGSAQYPPGSRPRVQIVTRAGAVCNLSVIWPDGQRESLPAQTADTSGACFFRPLVPIGMRSGAATALGTVEDIFGFNLEQITFPIGGTQIPPGDNIASLDTPFDARENRSTRSDAYTEGVRGNGDDNDDRDNPE